MRKFISRRYDYFNATWPSFFWTAALCAFAFLLLVLAEHYLSMHGLDGWATVLWYFPAVSAVIYLPFFLVAVIGRKVFKIDALQTGDRVEIVTGEHCGFTGRILQIYPGQNAIRVLVETISGTKIDLIFKREQLYKLRLKRESRTLAS